MRFRHYEHGDPAETGLDSSQMVILAFVLFVLLLAIGIYLFRRAWVRSRWDIVKGEVVSVECQEFRVNGRTVYNYTADVDFTYKGIEYKNIHIDLGGCQVVRYLPIVFRVNPKNPTQLDKTIGVGFMFFFGALSILISILSLCFAIYYFNPNISIF